MSLTLAQVHAQIDQTGIHQAGSWGANPIGDPKLTMEGAYRLDQAVQTLTGSASLMDKTDADSLDVIRRAGLAAQRTAAKILEEVQRLVTQGRHDQPDRVMMWRLVRSYEALTDSVMAVELRNQLQKAGWPETDKLLKGDGSVKGVMRSVEDLIEGSMKLTPPVLQIPGQKPASKDPFADDPLQDPEPDPLQDPEPEPVWDLDPEPELVDEVPSFAPSAPAATAPPAAVQAAIRQTETQIAQAIQYPTPSSLAAAPPAVRNVVQVIQGLRGRYPSGTVLMFGDVQVRVP